MGRLERVLVNCGSAVVELYKLPGRDVYIEVGSDVYYEGPLEEVRRIVCGELISNPLGLGHDEEGEGPQGLEEVPNNARQRR
ncbi:hypothetical protein JCM16161A_01900 [Vulcanisaeta sp. JCM 16161]|uniref:hypothetical protein n=1 Tax=Vulcanisaeta sp. JCM 16161 TaxID=1295372 RepID=UPI0006CF9E8A|nr:hypothetical protein [Vulcanisaeta sp. JCM 16161]